MEVPPLGSTAPQHYRHVSGVVPGSWNQPGGPRCKFVQRAVAYAAMGIYWVFCLPSVPPMKAIFLLYVSIINQIIQSLLQKGVHVLATRKGTEYAGSAEVPTAPKVTKEIESPRNRLFLRLAAELPGPRRLARTGSIVVAREKAVGVNFLL